MPKQCQKVCWVSWHINLLKQCIFWYILDTKRVAVRFIKKLIKFNLELRQLEVAFEFLNEATTMQNNPNVMKHWLTNWGSIVPVQCQKNTLIVGFILNFKGIVHYATCYNVKQSIGNTLQELFYTYKEQSDEKD